MLNVFRCLFLCSCCWLSLSQAQPTDSLPFTDVQLAFDTLSYSWTEDARKVGDRRYLSFVYTEAQPAAELRFLPRPTDEVVRLTLLASPDYEATDTTLQLSDGSFRSRIRFTGLSRKQAPSLTYRLTLAQGDTVNVEVPLFPIARSTVMVPPAERVWYVGQEREVPLETSLPQNIKPAATWTKTQGVAYRIVRKKEQPVLRVVPLAVGSRELRLPYQTLRPTLNPDSSLRYERVIEPFPITIKRGRTQFIALDRDAVELPRGAHVKEVEVSFPQQVSLSLKRTYRLEPQESDGGPLIAELFIREITNSNQMKAMLRVYAYHRRSEGVLYLKAEGETLFTMNLDIVPTPHLDAVELRRPGGDWQRDLTVYPGERLDLRLQGESLTRTKLAFEQLLPLRKEGGNDSIRYSDTEILARVSIPVATERTQFPLLMDGQQTPYVLRLREYQRPRPLDFVRLTFERKTRVLTEVPSPIVVDAPLNSFQLRFLRDSIDLPGDLYGPQYLTIAVEVWSKDNQRLEARHEETICLCPGPSSPRRAVYEQLDCTEGVVDLNKLLTTPSYELPGWARIRLTVSHAKDHYAQGRQSRQVDLILRQTFEVGLEVSLPVPIILARFNDSPTDNLTSVGFAAFAQLRFYRQRGINELVPIQAAFGVMATDVFAFTSEARRDWGLTAMACFYPITGRQTWSIPFYMGGGYLLDEGTGFFFMGPGLSVQF